MICIRAIFAKNLRSLGSVYTVRQYVNVQV